DPVSKALLHLLGGHALAVGVGVRAAHLLRELGVLLLHSRRLGLLASILALPLALLARELGSGADGGVAFRAQPVELGLRLAAGGASLAPLAQRVALSVLADARDARLAAGLLPRALGRLHPLVLRRFRVLAVLVRAVLEEAVGELRRARRAAHLAEELR